MMNIRYILEGKQPVPCEDPYNWAQWMETANRQVAEDYIGDVRISTVFLGLNQSFHEDYPLFFETMVFGGKLHEDQHLYSTWDDAVSGHNEVVKKVREVENEGT